jgi:hypothetical protein
MNLNSNNFGQGFGRIPSCKLFTEDRLHFLREEKAVVELAQIIAHIQSKQGPDSGDWLREERYENIEDCLEAHSENLDSFEQLTNELLSSLQTTKELLFPGHQTPTLTIQEDTIIEDIKLQFERIFRQIRSYIEAASKSILKIKELNPELLYCYFNYETWGTTWSSELYIPKKMFDSEDWDKIVQTAITRILKFHLFNKPFSLVEQTVNDYDEELYNSLGGEDYDKYVYSDRDYFVINSRVCHEILKYFKDIIVKLRNACRTILLEISKYRKSVETINDDIYKVILDNVFKKFKEDEDFRKVLKNIPQKKMFLKSLTLLYDYKKEIEESELETTHGFDNERQFKNHLFNYLNRTREGNLIPSKEVERGRGRIDILVNNILTLELKFQKESTNMAALSGYHPQLRETMQSWGSKLGFLILLDTSRQDEPMASRENYFEAKISKGGKGILPNQDKYPEGIVSILIFGGIRKRPSEF